MTGTARPSPAELWQQAGGSAGRYRQLLREHGHLLAPGDEGYDDAPGSLPCGWPRSASQVRRLEATGALAPDETGAANAVMRTCAWCETHHPEHVSIEWTHGERLYFCTDTCHREWCEHG